MRLVPSCSPPPQQLSAQALNPPVGPLWAHGIGLEGQTYVTDAAFSLSEPRARPRLCVARFNASTDPQQPHMKSHEKEEDSGRLFLAHRRTPQNTSQASVQAKATEDNRFFEKWKKKNELYLLLTTKTNKARCCHDALQGEPPPAQK